MTEPPGETPKAPTSLTHEQVELLYYGSAREGQLELLAEFLRQGADPNRPDARGFPPLILASYNGHAEAVDLLLKAGAAVDARDAKGATALAGVAFKDELEIARQLIAAGADPDAPNGMGRTPLMFAVMFGRKAMVDLLLEAGADPTLNDGEGKSALDDESGGANAVLESGRLVRYRAHFVMRGPVPRIYPLWRPRPSGRQVG
jgi:ankyrin repeat protein